VFATAGGVFTGGTAGHNYIVGGDGPTTITGGGNGDSLFATGSAPTLIRAGSGNETLDGSLSVGNNTFRAGSGADQVIGGFGNDTMSAGSGHSTLQGGTGADVFQFLAGNASTSFIVDFSPGDKVSLLGYGRNEINYALSHEHVKGGAVTVSLSDNTKITFANLTDLSRSSFS
jgi:Ca2+-binding RTX toxin-like protein